MSRHGFVLRIKPDRINEYKRYHADVWPEILAALSDAAITNYSIFLKDDFLFGYWEYIGPPNEYETRLAGVAQAPRMREWWDIMEDIQVPLETRAPGEWWAEMEEVFHLD